MLRNTPVCTKNRPRSAFDQKSTVQVSWHNTSNTEWTSELNTEYIRPVRIEQKETKKLNYIKVLRSIKPESLPLLIPCYIRVVCDRHGLALLSIIPSIVIRAD